MLKIEDIRAINFEITSKCGAKCPFCSRGQKIRSFGNQDISLADLKHLPRKLLQQLRRASFSGNFGDFSCNNEFVDIVAYLRDLNPDIVMDGETNGSAQSSDWWRRLGTLFGNGNLIFALDGLKDTHPLHRRGTQFKRIIKNLEAFASGGGRAYWKFIVFAHNEHQIAEAESMAQKYGCRGFFAVSSREYTDILKQPKTIDVEIKRDIYNSYYRKLDVNKQTARCKPFHSGSIYIAADGSVHPCCFAHCMFITEHNRQFDFIVPLIKQYQSEINFKTKPIKEIIEGPYFKAVAAQSPTNSYCQLKCNRYKKAIRQELVLYDNEF